MRASYRAGVAWVGDNDESAEMDPEVVADVPSVLLLAELFGKDPQIVARDVVRYREKHL